MNSTSVRNVLRASPRIVFVSSVLAYLITSQEVALRFAAYFICTELFGWLLKMGVSPLSELIPSIIYRPSGAGDCVGCGNFPQGSSTGCVNVNDQIGMPSGHAISLMMSATFWSLWIWYKGEGNLLSKMTRISLLLLLAVLVVISRTPLGENCHTFSQATTGAMIGLWTGIGFFFLDKKLF